jgi:hypothetical protein
MKGEGMAGGLGQKHIRHGIVALGNIQVEPLAGRSQSDDNEEDDITRFVFEEVVSGFSDHLVSL